MVDINRKLNAKFALYNCCCFLVNVVGTALFTAEIADQNVSDYCGDHKELCNLYNSSYLLDKEISLPNAIHHETYLTAAETITLSGGTLFFIYRGSCKIASDTTLSKPLFN